jgi:sugar lactone lactonase YvrE
MPTADVWYTPADETGRYLPEGPQRRDATMMLWVNIQTGPQSTTGELYERNLKTLHTTVHPLPARCGFALPHHETQKVILGLEKQLAFYDLPSRQIEPLATISDASPHTIINDGELTPDGGGILFGTKDVRFAEPIAHLYHFDIATRGITVLRDQQTCSNGKVFSTNGLTLYDIDTPTKTVVQYAFDPDRKSLQYQRVALDLTARDGYPDGMVAWGEQHLLVAFYHPGDVAAGCAELFNLDTGQSEQRWLTPGSPRVTCPLLWPDGTTPKLLLTTAEEGMPSPLRQRSPNAGCLFLAEFR